ncbi:MAG: extracellular solute-binding protein [Deltaproteobacteria bacterium]|nr:extracellular solute-binding protein [Deltaproteobacteria bacterium]
MQSGRRSSLAMFLLFLAGAAHAQEDQVVLGAKAERRVVWYSGYSLSLLNGLTKSFEAKYPFIKVDLIRSPDEKTLNRVATEKKAGKVLFDVINSQLLPMMVRLNVIGTYSFPGAEVVDAKYKDPSGHWVALHMQYYVLSYNTKMVPKNQVPSDWLDLLDPKWKGQIGMDPEEFEWLGAMSEFLGEEKATKLMMGLSRQEIRWHKGHTLLAQFMAAGEFALSLSYAHRIEDMKKKGAPVEWVRSTKPIVGSLSKLGLSAAPPHPNAARLLVNFLSSKEGQNEFHRQGHNPLFPGIVPKDSPLHPAGLEIHVVSPKITLNLHHQANEFERIFGPRR